MEKCFAVLSVLACLGGCAPPSSADRVALDRADAAAGDVAITIDSHGPADVAQAGGAITMPDAATGGTGAGSSGSGGGEPTPPGSTGAGGAGGNGPTATPDADPPGDPDSGAAEALPPPTGPVASLIVADPTAMAATDIKLKNTLASMGFTVVLGDDDGLVAQTNGSSLVVLSATVASEKITTKYRDTPIPTLVLEPGVFDDMMMTGAAATKDFGEDNATQVAITGDHALAAQLKGNVTVVGAATKLGWGKPAATALKVASLGGVPAKTAIFGYEKAVVMMPPFLAPARRVGLFVTVTAAANLNPDGDKLLAAAIGWLAAP
jgi:hypothetical protein